MLSQYFKNNNNMNISASLFGLNTLLYANISSHPDPNIPETGEQLARSNHGPDNCCYRYCSASADVCAVCRPPTSAASTDNDDDTDPPSPSSPSSSFPHNDDVDAADWWHTASADDTQVFADHCPAATTASTGPRCQTPFQQSIAAKSSAGHSPQHRSGRRWLSPITFTTAAAKPTAPSRWTHYGLACCWLVAAVAVAVGCTALERLLVGVLRSLGGSGGASGGISVTGDSCRCVAALALAVLWCNLSS